MNGDKRFKEIYDKFNGNFGELIIEHVRVVKELEKCQRLLKIANLQTKPEKKGEGDKNQKS